MALVVVDERTLRLSGAIDVRCTAELREVLYELIRHAPGDVVVDLAAVESIDLVALRLVAVANRTAEREGRRVVLRACPPVIRRLLHLSHLRWMLSVEPDGEGVTHRAG